MNNRPEKDCPKCKRPMEYNGVVDVPPIAIQRHVPKDKWGDCTRHRFVCVHCGGMFDYRVNNGEYVPFR